MNILLLILLYFIIVIIQIKFATNTIKNWFNNEIKELKYQDSMSKIAVKNAFKFSFIPLVTLLATMMVYDSKYWTLKNIKILNP